MSDKSIPINWHDMWSASETALAEANKRNESWQKSWNRLNRVFKTTSDKTIDQDMEIGRLAEQLRLANEENAKLREDGEWQRKMKEQHLTRMGEYQAEIAQLQTTISQLTAALAVHTEEKP